MSIHFSEIVYGPIKSRRLGSSLGRNLSPIYGKLCTFDCIYCECGWNKDGRNDHTLLPYEVISEALEARIREHAEGLDSITFSGNGEPTLHPDFPKIIERTREIRATYCPKVQISVLSNATQLHRAGVKEALASIENPILKIDSALEDIAAIIDRPTGSYSVEQVKENLKWFNGNFVLQTMFLKGNVEGRMIDCTSPEIAEPWIELAKELHPREVMMYTLDRVPPLSGLEKVEKEKMEQIADRLRSEGIKVIVK